MNTGGKCKAGLPAGGVRNQPCGGASGFSGACRTAGKTVKWDDHRCQRAIETMLIFCLPPFRKGGQASS